MGRVRQHNILFRKRNDCLRPDNGIHVVYLSKIPEKLDTYVRFRLQPRFVN